MSHVVSIQTQIRDPAAVAAACLRLGLPPPVRRMVQLFSTTVEGLAVEVAGAFGCGAAGCAGSGPGVARMLNVFWFANV
jgi:hypothetical protein